MGRYPATLPRPAHGSSGQVPGPGPGALIEAGELEWRRRGWSSREWELLAGGQRIGGLVVRLALRDRVQLDGPSGAWKLHRHFWSGRIEMVGLSGVSLQYEPRLFSRDVVQCAPGSRYEWGRPAWWKSEWDITTESGFPVVTFRPRSLLRRQGYYIDVELMGRRLPELEGLILLGAYRLTRTRGHAH